MHFVLKVSKTFALGQEVNVFWTIHSTQFELSCASTFFIIVLKKRLNLTCDQWRIQYSPDGGCEPLILEREPIIWQGICQKTAWKWKELDRDGGARRLAPPSPRIGQWWWGQRIRTVYCIFVVRYIIIHAIQSPTLENVGCFDVIYFICEFINVILNIHHLFLQNRNTSFKLSGVIQTNLK